MSSEVNAQRRPDAQRDFIPSVTRFSKSVAAHEHSTPNGNPQRQECRHVSSATAMKFLFDTNIWIPLEPTSIADVAPMTSAPLEFVRLASEPGNTIYLHPASFGDFANDTNAVRRHTRARLLLKYRQLPDPPPLSSLLETAQGAAIAHTYAVPRNQPQEQPFQSMDPINRRSYCGSGMSVVCPSACIRSHVSIVAGASQTFRVHQRREQRLSHD